MSDRHARRVTDRVGHSQGVTDRVCHSTGVLLSGWTTDGVTHRVCYSQGGSLTGCHWQGVPLTGWVSHMVCHSQGGPLTGCVSHITCMVKVHPVIRVCGVVVNSYVVYLVWVKYKWRACHDLLTSKLLFSQRMVFTWCQPNCPVWRTDNWLVRLISSGLSLRFIQSHCLVTERCYL